MKWTKVVAAVCGILAVLLAAAAVAIRVFLPPEKIKALAVAQADKSLHRKLEIKDVSVGLFTGLRIDGLRLSESPDFSKGEFLKADRFTLSPEWLPLLSKKLVARGLELDGASVNVIKGKDGRFNFADLTDTSAPAPAPAAAPASHEKSAAAPLALAVQALTLRGVTLHYADRKQGSKADLKLATVDIKDFSLSGPFPLSVELEAAFASGGKSTAASFKAKGTANLGGGEPARVAVDLESFSLSTRGKAAAGSLRFENASAPKIALSLATPALDASFLNEALGGSAVPAGVVVPAIKAEASIAYAAPAVDVSSLKISIAGAALSGSARISDINAKNPQIGLDASASKVNLASLGDADPALKALGLSGVLSLSIKASGAASAPKIAGSLSLDGVGGKALGQTLEKTTGQIRFTESSFDMPQLTGRLDGGDFKLKIAAANPAAPTVNISGSLSLLDLGALQKLAGEPQAAGSKPASGAPSNAKPTKAGGPVLKTSGDIVVEKTIHPNFQCGKMTLTWNLSGLAADMRNLNGTAKLDVGAGQATNILDFAASRGGLVRAMIVPLQAMAKAGALHIPGLNLPDMQNIPFSKIVGNYSASRGVVTMQPFQLDSPTLGMMTTGSVDLGAQTANLKTATKTSLGEIDLLITGPFSNLSVKPNVSQQLQSTAKQLLQQQGKALLNNFFHR